MCGGVESVWWCREIVCGGVERVCGGVERSCVVV